MESTKRILIVLIVVILAAVPLQSAEEPAAGISNTREASHIVKITANPGVLPLNIETVDSLLRSSSVGGKAARDILAIPLSEDFFYIEHLAGSIGQMRPEVALERLVREEPAEYDVAMMMEMDMRRATERERDARARDRAGRGREATGGVVGPVSRRSGAGIDGGLLGDVASPRPRVDRIEGGRGLYGAAGRTSRRDRTGAGGGRLGALYDEGATAVPRRTRAPIPTPLSLPAEQTFLFRLSVELPERAKPCAEEFAAALVNNLRETLFNAHRGYESELREVFRRAKERHSQAQLQLTEALEQAKAGKKMPTVGRDPADAAVYEQLEQIVDLPQLTQDMSLADVIGELENSVEPPLQIRPNWRDLLDNAEVEPATPAGMEPLTGVKLRKALEILLAGVSNEWTELGYVVDEGVITVATRESLQPKMVIVAYETSGLVHTAGGANALMRLIEDTIEPDSWYETGDFGEGRIVSFRGNMLAILQTPEVHRKIQDFLQSVTVDMLPADAPADIPAEMLLNEKRQLLREKRLLEMDVAQLEARSIAIGEQVSRISDQMAARVNDDPVTEELKRLLDIQVQRLEDIKESVRSGRSGDIPLTNQEEKISKTSIELAQRAEQIRKSTGGDQLVGFSNELANITIELAEKRAGLQIVTDQLDQIENQLTSTATLDPKVVQIRLAREALTRAQNRLNELNIRISNLQPPTVTVLGAE